MEADGECGEPATREPADPYRGGVSTPDETPVGLPPEMAKYFQPPPSLAEFEPGGKPAPAVLPPVSAAGATSSPSSPDVPGAAEGLGQAATPPLPPRVADGARDSVRPTRKGIRQRSAAESWARGLTVITGCLGLLALLATAGTFAIELPIERALANWAGTGCVAMAAHQARQALLEHEDDGNGADGQYWRHGGVWLLAGLAVFFGVPPLLAAVSG